jgi:hypothetical protein
MIYVWEKIRNLQSVQGHPMKTSALKKCLYVACARWFTQQAGIWSFPNPEFMTYTDIKFTYVRIAAVAPRQTSQLWLCRKRICKEMLQKIDGDEIYMDMWNNTKDAKK